MCFSKHCGALDQIQELKGVVFKAYVGSYFCGNGCSGFFLIIY